MDTFTKKKINIKAEFLIPNNNIDRPIFLDVLMNHPVCSKMCFVDERIRMQKEKGGLYLYFLPPGKDESKLITCSVTEQIVEKTNIKLMTQHPMLKVDIPYLRVRITRVDTEENAILFQQTFTKIMSLYQKERHTLIKEYDRYIENFTSTLYEMSQEIEKRRKRSTRIKSLLKDVNPDQFIPGYSRICQANRSPKIIEEKINPNDPEPPIVDEMESEGKQVMLFPKNSEDGKQYYYSCEHNKSHKFPGLRLNTLSNYEKYPIVPCCFKKDHRSKPRSVWKDYYEYNKTFDDFKVRKNDSKDDDEKHIFISNKILKSKRQGTLPKNIDEYFKSIDTEHQYYRKGVNRTCNSVIEVLLYATDDTFEDMDTEEKIEKLSSIRKELLSLVDKSDMFQQAYNYTPELIKEYLNDQEKYIDPKLFIRLLEEYFKCYIFIFSRNDKNPFGTLDCPQNVKMYLQLQKKRRSHIFIYEHMGSEDEREKYPQCELIVRVSENEERLVFSSSSQVIERTQAIFKEMYTSNPKDISIQIKFKTEILRQELDYQGKLRFIQFSNNVCILTDPLPPLQSVFQGKCEYKTVSMKTVSQFLEKEDAEDIKEHIVSNNIVGVHARVGDVSFYIPTRHIATSGETQIEVTTPIFSSKRSELEIYNDFSKLARYLIEYMYYLFSLDYQNNKPEQITSEYIIEFVERNIEIDPDFLYGDVPRMFSLLSGVMKDSKLIVHNVFTLKKLLYCLRLKLRDNEEELKQYSSYKYIKEYYKDIRDFSHIDNQPILYGKDSLKKWIDNIKPNYTLYESIKIEESTLFKELSKYDTTKPYMIVLTAKWHRPSKNLLSRLSPVISVDDDKRNLFKKYGKDIHFVYIDIDENKSFMPLYDISSVPYILFLKITDNKIISETGRIVGTDNTNQNLKMIENKITELLAEKE